MARNFAVPRNRKLPLLHVLVLLFGIPALGFWAHEQLQPSSPRAPRAVPAPHSHGETTALPPPAFPKDGPDKAIPDYGLLPGFRLVESLGEPLTRDGMMGRAWVASFLFTSCAGTCTTTAKQTRILQDSLPEGAVLVSVSVDPGRDTPAVLQAYAQGFGRRVGSWLLATGDPHEVEKLAADGFFLGARGTLFHSTRLALVDTRGHFRGFYESTDEAATARLIRDLALVMAAGPPDPSEIEFEPPVKG